jgi:hypothetical protein
MSAEPQTVYTGQETQALTLFHTLLQSQYMPALGMFHTPEIENMESNTNHAGCPADLWTDALRIVTSAARRAGFDASTADDLAQTVALRMMQREYKGDRCPSSPRVAAIGYVRLFRRVGWGSVLPRSTQPRGDEQTRAVEMATMAIYRERSANLSPAELVATVSGWGTIQRAAATRAAVAHGAIDAALASQGVGPTACVHEPYTTPSIYGTGPGTAPPTRGLPATPGDGTEHRPMRDGDRWATHGRA